MSFVSDVIRDLEKILGFKIEIYYNINGDSSKKINHPNDFKFAIDEKGKRHEFDPCDQYHQNTMSFSFQGAGDKFVTRYISYCCLQQLPGCCGVCLSTNSYVFEPYRNKGIATRLNKFRYDVAKFLGFGTLLCTDIADNIPQVKLLNRNGWKVIHSFKNPRTSNQVNLSICDIIQTSTVTSGRAMENVRR